MNLTLPRSLCDQLWETCERCNGTTRSRHWYLDCFACKATGRVLKDVFDVGYPLAEVEAAGVEHPQTFLGALYLAADVFDALPSDASWVLLVTDMKEAE